MKLNLPSTWTSEKILTLFLFIFLQKMGVKSGSSFEECLNSFRQNGIYNSLTGYFNNVAVVDSAINNEGVLYFTCASDSCFNSGYCNSAAFCSFNATQELVRFFCKKINQNIFCDGGNCGGIIGDKNITTNTTFGNCLDLDTMANYLSRNQQNNTHWACPDGNNAICSKIKDCNWDNGGWTCDSYSARGFSNNNKTDCILQWMSTFSSTGLSSLPENNPHLAEKIAIPIGTTVGVSSAGGLAYYFWRKKKTKNNNQQLLTDQAIKLSTLDQSKRINQNELEQLTQKKIL